MKKKLKIMFVFISVVILALLLAWIIPLINPAKKVQTNNIQTIPVNYTNLASELSKNSMIKTIPDNAVLLLKFYNFNSGEREWEKSYILRKGKVTEGEEKADITLTLDSKYLKELTNNNFCSIIKLAKKNGDLGFETSLSTTSMLWKFKGMMKYKDCFGI